MNTCQRVVVTVAVVLFGASVVWAHGDPVPQRGGILEAIGVLDFELVVKADKIDLYVSDDEEPVPSEQMSGALTIVSGADKSKAVLEPAGINRLRATGVTAESGNRVVALVTMPDGKSLAVQFAIP